MGTPRGYLRPPSFMQGVLPVSCGPRHRCRCCLSAPPWPRSSVSTSAPTTKTIVCTEAARVVSPATTSSTKLVDRVRVVVHVSWGLAVSESSERDRWIHSFANLSPALRTGRLDRRPRRSRWGSALFSGELNSTKQARPGGFVHAFETVYHWFRH